MGLLSSLFARRAPQAPSTLQEYLRLDRTGRAEQVMVARRELADRSEFLGMGEVPRSNDESRGYAFVVDLFNRNSGERVSEILDKMVGYGQILRRGGGQ